MVMNVLHKGPHYSRKARGYTKLTSIGSFGGNDFGHINLESLGYSSQYCIKPPPDLHPRYERSIYSCFVNYTRNIGIMILCHDPRKVLTKHLTEEIKKPRKRLKIAHLRYEMWTS